MCSWRALPLSKKQYNFDKNIKENQLKLQIREDNSSYPIEANIVKKILFRNKFNKNKKYLIPTYDKFYNTELIKAASIKLKNDLLFFKEQGINISLPKYLKYL